MPISTITVDGQTVTLVPFVCKPAPKSVEPWISDSVASVTSVFTGQTQRQGASGADLHGMTLTYARMTRKQAAPLLGWLKQMRGMARATLLTPPDYDGPLGNPAGTPIVSGAHVASATTLYTTGWTANRAGLLEVGDYIQIGYRLHTVLDRVNSDSSGNASFEVWPSLREDIPAVGTGIPATPIITGNPQGLFSLAANKRNWSVGLPNLTSLSVALMEYR